MSITSVISFYERQKRVGVNAENPSYFFPEHVIWIVATEFKLLSRVVL